jgi:hypothetical protein
MLLISTCYRNDRKDWKYINKNTDMTKTIIEVENGKVIKRSKDPKYDHLFDWKRSIQIWYVTGVLLNDNELYD